MNTLLLMVALLLLSAPWAFAHEEGIEITNIAEADWLGPVVAACIIALAIIVARIIRKRSANQIMQNN